MRMEHHASTYNLIGENIRQDITEHLMQGCPGSVADLHKLLMKLSAASNNVDIADGDADANFLTNISHCFGSECGAGTIKAEDSSLVMARYCLAKFLVNLFIQYPEVGYWKNFFTAANSVVLIEFLTVLLRNQQEWAKRAGVEITANNIAVNWDLSAIMNGFACTEKETLVSQTFSLLEQCFHLDILCSNQHFIDHFVKNWESLKENLLFYGFKYDSCMVQRRALNFLSAIFNFCLQKRSMRVNPCETKSFQEFYQVVVSFPYPVTDTRKFCQEFHWFGSGHTEIAKGSSLRGLVVLTLLQQCTLRIIQDVATTSAVSELEQTLEAVSCVFKTSFEMVDYFLNNDEQLMDMQICCCLIRSKIKDFDGSKLLSPHEIWLNMMQSIAWDSSVVLDWLTSETSALLMLLLYLKLTATEWPEFLEVSRLFQPKKANLSDRYYVCDQEKNRQTSDKITVSENLGRDVTRTREIHFCPASTPASATAEFSPVLALKDTGGFEKMCLKLFSELYSKLDRLHFIKALPFNPKPLLRLLSKVDKISQQIEQK